MRLLVGHDIGLIKDVDLFEDSTRYVWNKSGADLTSRSICWADDSKETIAVGRASGSIDIVRFDSSLCSWSLLRSVEIGEEPSVLLRAGELVVAICESSVVEVDWAQGSVRRRIELAGGPYTVVASNDGRRVAAAKGLESPIVVEEGAVVWKGKNAPDTSLQLTAQFQTTALLLVAELLVAGDATGKLRVYEVGGQRKPLLEFSVHEAFALSNNYTGTTGKARPIKKLALSPDKKLLFVGDTFGTVVALSAEGLQGCLKTDARIGTQAHKDAFSDRRCKQC